MSLRTLEDQPGFPVCLSRPSRMFILSPLASFSPGAVLARTYLFLSLFPGTGTLFPPPASCPFTLALPVVFMAGYVSGQEAGRAVGRTGAGFTLDSSTGTPSSGSRALRTYASPRTPRFAWGVEVGKGVFAKVPFSSRNTQFSQCFSQWIWPTGPSFGLLRLGHSIKGLVKAFPAHQT